MDDKRISVAALREQQQQYWPEAFVGAEPAVLRVLRLADTFMRETTGALRAFELQTAEFDVLAALRRQAPPYAISPTALCQALLISSGGLTKVLRRLELAGLIRRPANPGDRRSLLVELSPEGQQRVEAAMAKIADLHTQRRAMLSETELAQLDQLLSKALAEYSDP